MKTRNRWIGIRGQFLWLMGAVLLFVAMGTAIMGAQAQRTSLLMERTLRGQSVLRSWSSLCRERLLSDETVNLAMWDFVDDLMKNESAVVEVYLVDTAGTFLMHNDQAKVGKLASLESLPMPSSNEEVVIREIESPQGSVMTFHKVISVADKRLGTACIAFSSAGIESGIQKSILKVIAVAASIGLLGLGLAALLVHQVLKPIRLLVAGVKRFGQTFDPQLPGSADFRVDFRASNEIGDLRDAFNGMTDSLHRTMAERQALKEETGILRVQATTDGMTGLFNKRQFEQDYPEMVDLARKFAKPLAVLMMDMDRFKQLNDTLGHGAGDQALKDLAHAINAKVRTSDRAYRLGGDEFILLALGASEQLARDLAVRIAQEYEHRKQPGNPTTISFGIVCFDGECTHQELLKAADEEMYRVKREKKAQR